MKEQIVNNICDACGVGTLLPFIERVEFTYRGIKCTEEIGYSICSQLPN